MDAVDRIERHIEIDAPIDIVWSVITAPEQMAEWLGGSAELQVSAGSEGRLLWRDKSSGDDVTVNVRVERCEPPHFFSFRWQHPDKADPSPSNAPLVEFNLEPQGEWTKLLLVESGIQGLDRSQQERERYAAEHSSGWDVIGVKLRARAEDLAARRRVHFSGSPGVSGDPF